MKKMLIEVNYDKLNNDSIVIFENKEWVAVPKSVFLDGVYKEIICLREEITELNRQRLEKECLIDIELSGLKKRIRVLEGEEDEPIVESESEVIEQEGEEDNEEEQ